MRVQAGHGREKGWRDIISDHSLFFNAFFFLNGPDQSVEVALRKRLSHENSRFSGVPSKGLVTHSCKGCSYPGTIHTWLPVNPGQAGVLLPKRFFLAFFSPMPQPLTPAGFA